MALPMTSIDLDLLRQGERRTLAKAITLVESKLDAHRLQAQKILEAILPATGNSIRIGISGSPGVGKSTFIEAFGRHLIGEGKKAAVLAVDPSSPLAGGSILGDKTRMEMLAREENAFIRPSPSEGTLGGVAHKTRETVLLCEAAGFDVILVETVGVGQSEYEVASMVDFFLVLMLPNSGDELQGIKKGIMELADALVINKADGDSLNAAKRTQTHYKNAMHLLSHASFWTPRVLTCSALENKDIDSIWSMIIDYRINADKSRWFHEKRASQNRQWLQKLLHDMLDLRLNSNPKIKALRPKLERQVVSGETTPFSAAQQLIALL